MHKSYQTFILLILLIAAWGACVSAQDFDANVSLNSSMFISVESL